MFDKATKVRQNHHIKLEGNETEAFESRNHVPSLQSDKMTDSSEPDEFNAKQRDQNDKIRSRSKCIWTDNLSKMLS